MPSEQCFYSICWTPLSGNTESFFGFPELLASLALMVIAWTTVDERYRFRISSAPLLLRSFTFRMVSVIGLLTLLTDLWRADHLPVLKGELITPALWQAVLGLSFLATFIMWAWFAFIKPPTFGKRNAKHFSQALFHTVLRGHPNELSVIADEIIGSIPAIVSFAPNAPFYGNRGQNIDNLKNLTPVASYAYEMLSLIADKRLCRVIVSSSPATALFLFREMEKQQKYGINIKVFASNLINEAIKNKDSFLYHESDEYNATLFGHYKPITKTLFGNYALVEAVGSLLDVDTAGWDSEQWEVYCKMVLMVIEDYAVTEISHDSRVLCRALDQIGSAIYDLPSMVSIPAYPNIQELQNLSVLVNFIVDAVEILNKLGNPHWIALLNEKPKNQTFYDDIAALIVEVVFRASMVRSPEGLCWSVQHNQVWFHFFNFRGLNGPAGKVIKHKVCRGIYNTIRELESMPNYRAAIILGFCLNVMQLKHNNTQEERDTKALHLAVLSWTRKNFAKLYDSNPFIAEKCLVENITYDAKNSRLVRTYLPYLSKVQKFEYLDIVPLNVD